MQIYNSLGEKYANSREKNRCYVTDIFVSLLQLEEKE